MPPAYFIGGRATQKLIRIVENYLEDSGIDADFASEVEIVMTPARLSRADAAMLTNEDQIRQTAAAKKAARMDPDRTRILVPPTLIIESVSPGHEAHDHRTKKSWSAEFGVPNYGILDAFARTLECHRLTGKDYQLDAQGRDNETVKPSGFPGLSIPLDRLWKPSKSR